MVVSQEYILLPILFVEQNVLLHPQVNKAADNSSSCRRPVPPERSSRRPVRPAFAIISFVDSQPVFSPSLKGIQRFYKAHVFRERRRTGLDTGNQRIKKRLNSPTVCSRKSGRRRQRDRFSDRSLFSWLQSRQGTVRTARGSWDQRTRSCAVPDRAHPSYRTIY
jgi:hypothetical protein